MPSIAPRESSVPCCVPWQLLSRRCSNQVCILLLQTRLALVLCQHRPLALSEKGKPNQPQAWRLFNEKVTRGPLTPGGRLEAASDRIPRPWIPSARTPASAPRHIPTAVAFHQRSFLLIVRSTRGHLPVEVAKSSHHRLGASSGKRNDVGISFLGQGGLGMGSAHLSPMC